MQRKMMTIGVVACVLALVIGGLSFAQPQRGQRGQRGGEAGEPGQRGQFDRGQAEERMAQMRQRMMEGWRDQLGASSEEWTVIGPRLERVMELNRQQMMAGGRGMMPGGGMRGPGGQFGAQAGPRRMGDQEPTAVDKAADELATVLENRSATPEQIRQRLTALRAAREKQRQELATAQQQLREVLTLPQEARMVMAGLLQ